MTYYTLVISSIYHDASYALFADDQLILYTQAERLEKEKCTAKITENSKCFFDYIRDEITSKIDLLVINSYLERQYVFEYINKKFEVQKIVSKEIDEHCSSAIVDTNKVQYFSHHCCHALSAFYMSPFDKAVCLIIDALGSGYQLKSPDSEYAKESYPDTWDNEIGISGTETTSILEIDSNYKRKYLYKKSQFVPVQLHKIKTKFGISYAPLCSFNGGGLSSSIFDNPEEIFAHIPYKFDASTHMDIGNMYATINRHLRMGLNGHGKVMGLSAYGNPNNNLPPFLLEGTILSNSNLFWHTRELNHIAYPQLAFKNLSFQDKANIAYEVQKSLEKIFLHHAEFIKNNSKIRNLVIGGGCALNILGISAIKEKYPEFNIFVDPIANDATHAIGLGIHYYNLAKMKGQLKKTNKFSSIYMGQQYHIEHMNDCINDFLLKGVESSNVI